MKTIITIIFLLINIIGNAQCTVPSNLTLSFPNPTSVQLGWTENGTATTWEIAIMPNFNTGDVLPTFGTVVTNNPIVLTNIPSGFGCYVFFIRSICSATEVSPWIAVASSGCANDIINYIATLSNDSFSLNTDDKDLQIAPNPSNKRIQLQMKSIIDKITVFDSLGKVILIQTQNTSEIDIENLSKGVYFIDVVSEDKHFFKKFIKE